MVGTTLSHYEILAEIGRGGMGVVYRALDTNLNREVALKVLPAELVADSEWKRRFVQEAQAAAGLTHPHIASVYEIGDWHGIAFITMELIDGCRLSDMLQGKPLPVPEVLALVAEVAEGLARAHERNVVHRDIKPANIMVTAEGRAKIIDFGLAKIVEPVGEDSRGLTTALNTAPGIVVGTTPYMSPEQARGIALDHRTDIFSLGVVLFEMIAGRRPFAGETTIDTLNAILTAPPPPLPGKGASRHAAEVQRVVHRCLEKKPDDRYQTARDLTSELRRLKRESENPATLPTPTRVSPTRGSMRWMTVAAAMVLVGAMVVLWKLVTAPSREAGAPRLTNFAQLTSAQGAESFPSWSPDGSRVTYVRQGDIWVSQPGGSSVNLTNDAAADFYPSWSPDGTQIAFASRGREGTNVGYYVLPALGGRPRRILATSGLYPARPAWSADGRTLLASTWAATGSVQLEMVNLESMKSQTITVPGRESIRGDLSWSRDNRFIAFVDMTSPLPEVSRLWLTRLSDHEPVALTDGLSLVRTPAFSVDARYLYYVSNRQGSSDLWLQQLGEDGSPIGDPQRLTSGIGMSSAALSYDDSKFAYSRGREVVANVWRVPLRDDVVTWADAQQLTFDEALIEFVDVTPDGRELVISSDRHGNQDIWRMPSAGGEMQPVTSEPTPDWRPSISADGQQLAFYAYRTGNREIWTMPLAGGPARQVTSHEAGDYHPTWSPDGSRIAFASNRRGQFSVWVVAATGGEPQLVAGNPGDNMPAWSPDGEWLAFIRIAPNGSRLFRVPAKGGAPEQITSVSGTGGPRWSRNGKCLYSMRPGAQIWEISVGTLMERQLADLSGRPGTMGQFGLATDGSWMYFTWQTADADLWTMDVVHE